jgi:hypothetical protein
MVYELRFQRTDVLIALISRIEAARAMVLRAPVAAQWESQLPLECLEECIYTQ